MKSKLLLSILSLVFFIGLAKATPLTATITGSTNVLCNGGSNGTATVLAGGGTSPYTYSWAPTGGTNPTATGLTVGSYTVTVTDFASNTATATVSITQPLPIFTTSTSSSDVSCFGGNNGYIDINVSGGTPPYSYLWYPAGGTTIIATGLSAGNYTVTVIDNNGCTGTTSYTITQPSGMTTTSTSTANTTCVTPNGTATAVVTGGTYPYRYLWSPGGQTNATATGLIAGTYACTITDSHGCSDTLSVFVPGISGLTERITGTPANSGCNGTATAIVTGGTSPYTFLWSPGGNTNVTATGLCAGSYCCFVTDQNGCTDNLCYTVSTSSCTFSLSLSQTAAICPNTGTATATASGGAAPYTYSWSPGGGTTATITGLSGGIYSVTVHDLNGCIASDTVSVSSASVSYSVSGNPTTIVAGDSTLLTASCNTSATFSWAPSALVTHPNSASSYARPTVTTEYTVTITTACGTFTDSVLITVNCFNLTMSSTPSYCTTGTATATASGGTPPYTYLWAPGGGTTATISALSAGTYSVTVHDFSGCSVTGSVAVSSATVSYTISGSPTTIVAPDSSFLNATCNVSATFSWAPSATVSSPNSFNTFAKPTVTTEYTVTINTACGSFIDSVLITVDCFSLTTVSTSSYCNSGTATAFASGGTLPYTYLWAPGGQTISAISALSAGIYTVTVHDFSGCSVTSTANVGAAAIAHSANGTPTSTVAGDSVLLRAICNVPATFSWTPPVSVTSPTSATTYAHPPVTTVYTVTITTTCGVFTDTVPISINCFSLAMSSTPAYTTFLCSSSYDGTATVTPSGGTPPYTYLWSPGGQTTATISGLYPATYSVTVHDHTGCSSMGATSVSSAAVSLTVSALPSTISVGDTSYLVASTNIAASYAWAPAASLSCTTCANPIATPTVTTTYTVTLTDTCGTMTDTVTVYVATCTNNYNEPICIVSVDTANKPVVIWGRTNSPPQGGSGSYVIYRENSSFAFVPVENQPLNVLSQYIDTGANPSLGPVSYKLATDDSCGQSALSAVNTTIYLTTTSALNVYILNWTAYVGFTPMFYRIYRGPTMSSMVVLDSVPGTLLTFHDTLPPLGSIYLVEAVNPFSPCVPTTSIRHRGLDSRPLSGSYSNGYNSGQSITTGANSIVANPQLTVYPNPSNGQFTLVFSHPELVSGTQTIEVYNAVGQVVYNATLKQVQGDYKIDLSSLASGIYTLRLQNNSGSTVKKLVIMKK